MSVASGCRVVLHQLVGRRYAGHSKWANIKHIKATKDAQRSALFTKLTRQIRVAIQEGGSASPDVNLRLSQAIEQAKRNCMPVATIQTAIQRSARSGKLEDCKRGLFEIRGPAGCIILCEVLTENLPRCKQTLAAIIKKHGVSFSDGGGRHLFEQRGVVEVALTAAGANEDLLTEHAIESGAEDVGTVTDESACFLCNGSEMQRVQAGLERLGYTVLSSQLEYLPTRLVQLEESHLDNLSILMDKLEGQEEVIKLYDNIG